eukprot:scaffold262174_cov26-Tisochrysis_lutea.AAC.1
MAREGKKVAMHADGVVAESGGRRVVQVLIVGDLKKLAQLLGLGGGDGILLLVRRARVDMPRGAPCHRGRFRRHLLKPPVDLLALDTECECQVLEYVACKLGVLPQLGKEGLLWDNAHRAALASCDEALLEH